MKQPKKTIAPGMSLEDGVLTIRHGGTVAITEAANGDWHLVQGARTWVIPAAQVAGITSIDIGKATRLGVHGSALHNDNFRFTGDGQLNVSGIVFTQAQNGNGVETNYELKDIDLYSVATTVNGTQADFIKLRWEILDDQYVAQGYYATVNEAFVRLGLEYVAYLEAGGEPFTDFIAKGSATRSQLLHDNLLGNLTRASIESRNFSDALEAELLALVPDAYENRAYFDGNFTNYGGAAHDAARAFDYDRDWSRPDYTDRNFDGTVDGRSSQDRNGDGVDEQMYYGTGNPVTDWNVLRHEGAGVELALKVKERGGSAYNHASVDGDGTAHYYVPEGTSVPNRARWNFDFAATVLPSGDDDAFVFKVFYDADPGAGVQLVDISSVLTEYGAQQNSSNYGFLDTDLSTPGVQTYGFGDGEFTIELHAYDAAGNLVAVNRVVVHVGDGAAALSPSPTVAGFRDAANFVGGSDWLF